MVNTYSVVIPVFNAAKTIKETLASVLAQEPAPKQVILVDDGSTDNSAALISTLSGPITLIKQENRGPGAATTLGFKAVTTPMVATIDADDIWLAGKISAQMAWLEANPSDGMVFCPLANFTTDAAQADIAGASGGWSRSTLFAWHSKVMQVGDIIDPVGRAGEMIDWFARAREMGIGLKMLDQVLALRRVHEGSLTWNSTTLTQGYLAVARAALLRKRAAQTVKVDHV